MERDRDARTVRRREVLADDWWKSNSHADALIDLCTDRTGTAFRAGIVRSFEYADRLGRGQEEVHGRHADVDDEDDGADRRRERSSSSVAASLDMAFGRALVG